MFHGQKPRSPYNMPFGVADHELGAYIDLYERREKRIQRMKLHSPHISTRNGTTGGLGSVLLLSERSVNNSLPPPPPPYRNGENSLSNTVVDGVRVTMLQEELPPYAAAILEQRASVPSSQQQARVESRKDGGATLIKDSSGWTRRAIGVEPLVTANPMVMARNLLVVIQNPSATEE